jgi:hypothetical protein
MNISHYEQNLQQALTTAINSNDLIASLTAFDDSGQNDRLGFVLKNYQKIHLSSIGHASLIQDAIASL